MPLLLLFLISAVSPAAQTPADMSFHSVSYVDIAPSSKPAADAAFKKYREASRKSDGFMKIEFFEQVGRPGHFCIIETWASPKAFDANAAANAKQFRNEIESMRLSDFDQRTYKMLSADSRADAANDRAIYVITHVDIGGQGTNAADLLKRLAEASRKENGNLRFDLLQHAMRANHFTVIEAWQNQKALDAHAAAPHTKQYRDGLAPISGSPLDERLYKAVE
jgi:quinol monooxygenase YgiN